MQFALFLCLAVVALTQASLFSECEKNFSVFMSKYHKKYATPEEKDTRHSIFCANMKDADRLNELNGATSFGITKFSDKTKDEFSVLLGRKNSPNFTRKERPVRQPKLDGVTTFPADATVVDWTAAGFVTPVKNQGQCG
jgi:cathepsin F